MFLRRFWCLFVSVFIAARAAWAVPALEALAQQQPYGPDHTWPALTAAQWTGDPNVDAVVILSIDDMRDTAKYETFLRPILNKLAEVGAPGAMSIFTNSVEPGNPQLQAWLKEGLSIEVHTIRHPCPQLCQGNLAEAKKTYDDCVELLGAIPNMRPVASRVPCCDSMNSASPRYFSEIFNRTTPGGKFLDIDSSVFCVFNPDDPSLPEELIHDDNNARGRFEKYLPFPAFTTTIANYPYPYVIGNTCWEFPCIVPSDWEAQNKNKPNAPQTVEDMKAAIDATVLKQGTYTLCYHPHGWIQAEQINALIDHVRQQHGERVKFLTFAQAAALLKDQLLQGQTLRAANGGENGVRLVDLNDDGFMDVVNGPGGVTRVWQPESRTWKEHKLPFASAAGGGSFAHTAGVNYIERKGARARAWRFDDGWKKDSPVAKGIPSGLVRAVDIDHDGVDELIAQDAVLRWNVAERHWQTCAFRLPTSALLADADGNDAGLRFVDLDEDRDLDIIYSNDNDYGVWLFESFETGWSTEALVGKRGEHPAAEEVPAIVTHGADNGFWTAKRTAWWHNEFTDTLPDKVDRRTFAQLLAHVKPRAKTVAEATASMRSPGRDVVAVAAEPLVRDPVCIAWDAKGRLWTAEMRDYPLGLNNDGTPGSEIRVLDDTDHDGIYDKATVFLEGLAFANGVIPWRNGALVTCAPEIFYAEDRDGDGKAEHKEVLYEGFIQGNQQHRINGLRWGGDGWIYAANGDSNGIIKCLKTGETVDIRGRDIRINPDTGELQTVTGNAQFGRARDDFGRWFGCANWSAMWYYTFDEHYQARNPFLSVPEPMDFFLESQRVYPVSVIVERFNDFHMAGFVTSGCGIEVYRDTHFGDDVNIFTCEPVHNLVTRARGRFNEGGFEGGRVPEERASEFLASTDPWCRPVMARTGPDGALYVADMYRAVIEHPEYINIEKQKEIDMRAGENEGRVWRVSPKGTKPTPISDLTALSTAALCAALKTENGALRDLVQQRIYELNDPAAAPELREVASDLAAPAAVRSAALRSLQMATALDAPAVAARLTDPAEGVVIEALRLADAFVATEPDVQAGVLAAAARAAGDAQALREQAAYTLGAWDDPRAWDALAKFFDGGDVLRIAALSSVNERSIATLWPALVATAKKETTNDFDAGEHEQVLDVVSSLLLKSDDAEARNAFAAAVFASALPSAEESWRWQAACSLLDAIERFGSNLGTMFGARPEVRAQAEAMLNSARTLVANADTPGDVRGYAARLLGRQEAQRAADAEALAKMVDARTEPELLRIALKQLQRIGTKDVPRLLIAGWAEYPPSLQGEAAEVLFSREEWTDALISALEKGTLSPKQLGAAQRQRLLTDEREGVHARVAKALGAAASTDRQPVIDRFRPALTLAGNRDHGKQLFSERCAVCHELDGIGHRVGADLASLTDKRPEAIIVSILDPSRSVETRYLSYDVETKDLSTFSGILTEESPTSLTLTGANGQEQTVLRSEITSIRSTNRSIMPEGLEENLAPQDVADVMAFVAGTDSAPKQSAGNAPKTVTPDADGSFACTAEAAEIRGKSLVYEEKTKNLGYWCSPDDHATWKLSGLKPGEYTVVMEWCCDNTQAGNTYRVLLGDNVLSGQVHGTGTWDVYRKRAIGTVRLSGKETLLTFAPDGELKGCLIDLRSLTFTPK